jgi:hypothetical protein
VKLIINDRVAKPSNLGGDGVIGRPLALHKAFQEIRTRTGVKGRSTNHAKVFVLESSSSS